MSSEQLAAAVEQEESGGYGLSRIWAKLEALRTMTGREIGKAQLAQAVDGLKTAPFTSMLTVLTSSIAFFLVAAMALVLSNVGDQLAVRRSAVAVSFYLRDDVKDDDLAVLLQEIRSSQDVEAISYHDKQQAFDSFKEGLGSSAPYLDGLEEENPFPAYFEIRLKEELASKELFDRFVNRFKENKAVERVYYSSALLERLGGLLKLARVGGAIAVAIMLAVCGFIVCNTIRLALYSRRKEIEIMRLVGSSEASIRTPFLMQGILLSVMGAVIALVSGYIGFFLASSVLSSSAILHTAFPNPHYLSLVTVLFILGAAVLVGALASQLALRTLPEE